MALQGGKGSQYTSNNLKVSGPSFTPSQIKAIKESPKGVLPNFISKAVKLPFNIGAGLGKATAKAEVKAIKALRKR